LSSAAIAAYSVFAYVTGRMIVWDAITLAIGGGCLGLMGFVCKQVQGGVRDRVLAILVLGIFVMFFWAAFEQAGNVLNVWADQQTNRYLTQTAPTPRVIPEVVEDKEAPKSETQKQSAPTREGVGERLVNLFTN